MENRQLEEILNRHVFNEAKLTLLKSIAENPDRFVGVFRSTTPELKLIQNLLQSREIRFGDAMEEVISALLQEMGFVMLPKRFITEEEQMSCDHYFRDSDQIKFYLIEQKMRDDHDSSKKRGQFENFRNKITRLESIHGNQLTGIMYFIDPSLEKNKNYYKGNIENLIVSLAACRREHVSPWQAHSVRRYSSTLVRFCGGATRLLDRRCGTLGRERPQPRGTHHLLT